MEFGMYVNIMENQHTQEQVTAQVQTPEQVSPPEQTFETAQQSQPSAEVEEAEAQATAHADALALKDAEIAKLKAKIAELKKSPGASTSQVVENDKKKDTPEAASTAEAFFNTRQRAKALYEMLP